MSLEESLPEASGSEVLTVRCDRFHDGDSVVLIGDAVLSIGQGCNASLEDVLILGHLLETYKDDWGKVLPAFSQQRVPDAHALRSCRIIRFLATRGWWLIFLRLTVGRLLHQWFPSWVKPFVFDLVLDTDLSYSQVLSLSQGWINKVKRSMPDHG